MTQGKAKSRLLVCHDERHIARLLEVNLKRQNHDVFWARDLSQAIALLENQPFDIVLIKAKPTGEDFTAVENWIANHESTKQIRLIRF